MPFQFDLLSHTILNMDASKLEKSLTTKSVKMVKYTHHCTSSSGARVKLKGDTSCRTQNVVYLMYCGKCGKQYVGEIKGPLNIRMNGHRDDWSHKRFDRSPTAEHFCLQGHDFLSHASVAA